MPNFLALRLTNGDEVHVDATDETDFGVERFTKGHSPFTDEWIECAEGLTVRQSEVVAVLPVILQSSPARMDHGSGSG